MTTTATASRLVIPQSDIDPQTSIVIPLQVFPAYNTFVGSSGGGGSPLYKVGINVALAPPGTAPSGAGNLYEFDTGGKGFFAGNVNVPPNGIGVVANVYDSGIAYAGEAGLMNVSFPEATPALSVPLPVLVGIISGVTYNGGSASLPVYRQVNGPLELSGDFGGSLAPSAVGNPPGNAVSLLTVLAQVGPQYGNGFIVDVGAYPNGATSAGRVIIGLTPQLRSLFTNTFAMTASGSYPPQGQTTPQSPVPTFSAALLTGSVTVGSQGPAAGIPLIFDTGAPHTTFHPGNVLTSDFAPADGDTVLVTAGNGNFPILNFQAGKVLGVDKVQMGSASTTYAEGYVNTGITPFFTNPIMFDLQNGVIGFPAPAA